MPEWLQTVDRANAGALEDLLTRDQLKDPEHEGVDDLCVGALASGLGADSPLFALTPTIGRLTNSSNDCVVTLGS